MPLDPNVKVDLAVDRGESELDDITGHRAVVGSLMNSALATRPDIVYAVAALSHYDSQPFTTHMTAAKRVLLYLKCTDYFRLHTNCYGIDIDIDIGNSLFGYSESNWANDSVDRKSQVGHVFLARNGAISWQSRKKRLFAMSDLEAEFIACLEASRQAKRLLQLQNDIHNNYSPLLPINCDNQGALTRITTRNIKARTKHIHICYHTSLDLHRQRIVNYSYVHTDDNVADILIKALTQDMHTKFTKAMGSW